MTLSPTASADQSCHGLTAADLEVIAVDVWAAYLVWVPRPLLPAQVSLGAADREVVCATVSVDGAWSGRVSVLLEPQTADEVTEAMLGGSPHGTGDVVDAIGELVNVVGGSVKSLMPSPSTLSLPMVERGPMSRLDERPSTTVCALDLAWGDRLLRIVVGAREQGPADQPVEHEAKGAR